MSNNRRDHQINKTSANTDEEQRLEKQRLEDERRAGLTDEQRAEEDRRAPDKRASGDDTSEPSFETNIAGGLIQEVQGWLAQAYPTISNYDRGLVKRALEAVLDRDVTEEEIVPVLRAIKHGKEPLRKDPAGRVLDEYDRPLDEKGRPLNRFTGKLLDKRPMGERADEMGRQVDKEGNLIDKYSGRRLKPRDDPDGLTPNERDKADLKKRNDRDQIEGGRTATERREDERTRSLNEQA